MITNSQLSTTESKKNKTKNQTKQTIRTGKESQKWRLLGGVSAGREKNGGKGIGNKQHNWKVQNRGMLRIV